MKLKYKNRKNIYLRVRRRRLLRQASTWSLFGVMGLSAYLLWLVYAPALSLPASAVSTVQAAPTMTSQAVQTDETNYIAIDKLNLHVPFYTGGEDTLDKGAWWRYPERGDPVRGGNFILSAHRFELGLTPERTKAKSPFYHLGSLQPGDKITIHFEGSIFLYQVKSVQDVKPYATWVENSSKKPILTLYTCSLEGQDKGRLVVIATPL